MNSPIYQICTSVHTQREANNETGDWQTKSCRQIDLLITLNSTLRSMEEVVREKNASNISVFIASDNPCSRYWFEGNVASCFRLEGNSSIKKLLTNLNRELYVKSSSR